MPFRNTPELKDENNEGKVKRYVHQPLTIDHYGIHASIKENGKVLISSAGTPVAGSKDGEYEYDEVEVPASLIFKLATLLKATRTVKFVTMSEAASLPKEKEEQD
ncbi:hypothetical protein HYZ97_03635 [Candidatus Pacearchaeota archaeon]|nr:hypothetical protein [Candidatus Pacearchaeota archaeon]